MPKARSGATVFGSGLYDLTDHKRLINNRPHVIQVWARIRKFIILKSAEFINFRHLRHFSSLALLNPLNLLDPKQSIGLDHQHQNQDNEGEHLIDGRDIRIQIAG